MSGRGILSLLAGALLLANLHVLAAGRQDAPRALGFVAAKGKVWIDKQPAPSGAMLFAGDVIATGEASAAVLRMQSGTAATLAENTEAALLPGSSSGQLTLRRGAMVIRSESPQPARVLVQGTTVVIRAEGGFPAVCRIAYVGSTGMVFAEHGRVEVHGRGAPRIVPPGNSTRLEAGPPQAAGQQAGTVSNAIPEEVVQRLGKGAETTLRLKDIVNWEDVVRTLRTGRVRIALLDGSFLNIGARSTMRITRHDPETQQTELELQLGRLRGEIVKLTKPGSSFQVRTQTAVIGVVGTIFSIEALQDLTRATCLDGVVTVKNINPAIVGEVTLQAGNSTVVPRAAPPSPAARVPTSRALSEVSQTNASETATSQVSQALQSLGATPTQVASTTIQAVAPAAAQVGVTAANAVTTATGATSAALSGVALSNTNEAQDNIREATSMLDQATSAGAAAAQAASDAAQTAIEFDAGVQGVIQVVSPSQPWCGCVE